MTSGVTETPAASWKNYQIRLGIGRKPVQTQLGPGGAFSVTVERGRQRLVELYEVQPVTSAKIPLCFWFLNKDDELSGLSFWVSNPTRLLGTPIDADDYDTIPEDHNHEVTEVYIRFKILWVPLEQQCEEIADNVAKFLQKLAFARGILDIDVLKSAEHKMAFFFRSKKIDMIKPATELLTRLWQPPKLQKTEEELAKLLVQIKTLLIGTAEFDTNPDTIKELLENMKRDDFLVLLARSIHLLPFEARKDSQAIFSSILRFRPGGSTTEDTPALSYVINERPEILVALCRGYSHRDSALPCGMVLREILRYESVAAVILYDQSQGAESAIPFNEIDTTVAQSGEGVFWEFFGYIDKGAFEVSADAFTTFREILTKHKPLVAQYLTNNFDLFFQRYNVVLIGSNSYVTKRQSIKLLGEILLDRVNYSVMTEYVTRGDHLKLCMNLLRDDRRMVQYEGFHVFKVFVANPKKSDAIRKILIQNRERLLKFLPPFLNDRADDEQFTDEKAFLIRQIELLPEQP